VIVGSNIYCYALACWLDVRREYDTNSELRYYRRMPVSVAGGAGLGGLWQ
jgi:hypothetical protein